MRLLPPACLAAAALTLVFITPATAAPRAIQPVPADECQRFADIFSKQLRGMKLTITTDGQPVEWTENILVSGTGCKLAGSKVRSSLPLNFDFAPLETDSFKGWSRLMDAGWDSTEGASAGISRGNMVMLYQYNYVLPEKYCKNARDLDACEEKNQNKFNYEFKAVIFTFTDGKNITEQDFRPRGAENLPQPAEQGSPPQK